MASGTQQHQHHQQQQQQQQQQHHQHQDHLVQHNNQMQFATNPVTSMAACFDSQQHHQHMHQMNTMSPISAPMSIDNTQGHMIPMNPHHHHNQVMDTVLSPGVMNQDPTDQSTSNIQQQHHHAPQHHQRSQILPLLLSPQPSGIDSTSADQNEQTESDQIIEQVISLENEYSDTPGNMTDADNNIGIMMSHHQQQQQQQHQQQQLQRLSDTNIIGSTCLSDGNQLSSSSEDLLNLLLEFEGDPPNPFGANHQLDPDEKAGIENIRKQLMSCEVQSDQVTNSMSPVISHMSCQPQQTLTTTHPQASHNIHSQQQQQQQIVSQTAPVISHHQQPHHLSNPGLSQHQQQSQHRLSVDQSLLQGSYSNVPVNTVPVSSSGQSYAPQQHQNVARISQSNPMSIVNNSPSPSWQQPQLSPYSPQSSHNNNRTTPSQQQRQQIPTMPQQSSQHSNTTSPQMQQLHHHHTLQRGSPSQSVSPPATTEPSPVVKKNPLLNAQLINSRSPSITPTRFMNSQTNVLNQNPILNSKLSQNQFVTTSGGASMSSPVGQNMNHPTQQRFLQQNQQSSNFNYELAQQQQQSNAQQHTPPLQTGVHMSMYGPSDQQQQATNQIFRTTTAANAGLNSSVNAPGITMGDTSSGGGLTSQQVKQEIRRKVQQPKQQHQTTSLLKQLLSDDNK